MVKINLIPPEYIARINRKVLIAKIAVSAAAAVAVVLMLSLWHAGRARSVDSRLADLTKQMSVLQKDVDKAKQIQQQIAEVQKYLDAITSLNKGRFIYTGFMQDLVKDLPATLWFSSVNTTLSGNVLSVALNVNSNSAYDLAYWINALEISGPYSDVSIGAISVTDSDMGKKYTVPITLKYTYQ